MGVAAIMEAALTQVLCEFDESGFYLAQTQVVQTEHLHAGAIDQIAVGIEMIQPCMCGGVFARIQYGGYFARGRFCLGQQSIDER